MPFLLRNIRLDLGADEAELPDRIANKLKVPREAIRAYAVVRKSLDARDHDDLHFCYHVEVALNEPPAAERRRLRWFRPNEVRWIEPDIDSPPEEGRERLKGPLIIAGFGPAGMFAALHLAELGYRPIVLERGRAVRHRHRDVMRRYYRNRDFDPESNLLFGEGGAGTYSDGKLYTRIKDARVPRVLQTLYRFGAAPAILTDSHPHIGSDHLPRICWNIRNAIEALGGEVRFESRLDDLEIKEGSLKSLAVNGVRLVAGCLLLAVGHSARDTYALLDRRGVALVSKPFQLGVRIEHPQTLVDQSSYGAMCGHPGLPPSEYHLVARGAAGDRDLFSFCMCPGGEILPTNESAGLVATNGASRSRRNSPFANAGLVITLTPEELKLGPLGALGYLQSLEQRAFRLGGETYQAPAQRAGDFLAQRPSAGALSTSFPLGGRWVELRLLMPRKISEALERGLPILEAQIPGFAGNDGVILAPETRASAPVRVQRDPETRQSSNVADLYPIGEGAGYAGGIVSAAIDGLKTAETLIRRFARP